MQGDVPVTVARLDDRPCSEEGAELRIETGAIPGLSSVPRVAELVCARSVNAMSLQPGCSVRVFDEQHVHVPCARWSPTLRGRRETAGIHWSSSLNFSLISRVRKSVRGGFPSASAAARKSAAYW